MAEIFYTLDQINDAFWELTMRLLGYNPDDVSLAQKVRQGWPPLGAPAWKRSEDVVFIYITEQESPVNQQIDRIYTPQDAENALETTGQTRVLNVSWVFYGPHGYDRAVKMRRDLFQPAFKEFLYKFKVFIVPPVSKPTRLPEAYANQYWERTDLQALFNSQIKFESTVPYLKSAGIQIIKESGDVTNVFVESE